MGETHTPIPDFVTNEIRGIAAVYVTGPTLLAFDDPVLRRVPFLFHRRRYPFVDIQTMKQKGICYGTNEEYQLLTYGRLVGSLPSMIQVHDEFIPKHRLVLYSLGIHVPYCFGAFHGRDIAQQVRVRSRGEYYRMIEDILPQVLRARMPKRKTLFQRVSARSS